MRYSDAYLLNHDIDWFFIANGLYVHAASAGGSLPEQVNDIEKLKVIQYKVEQLPDIYSNDDIAYNDAFLNNVPGINGEKGKQQYIESFTAMARKGFVSFDRTNILEPTNNQYHLVCRPRIINMLPQGLELVSLNENNLEVMTDRGLVGLTEFLGMNNVIE